MQASARDFTPPNPRSLSSLDGVCIRLIEAKKNTLHKAGYFSWCAISYESKTLLLRDLQKIPEN